MKLYGLGSVLLVEEKLWVPSEFFDQRMDLKIELNGRS
jgi:hypothetical protein